MKNLWLLSLFSGLIIFQGCSDEDCSRIVTYQAYNPIWKSAEELLPTVSFVVGRELRNPGKIYYYGQYILINERNEGVHIIDNSNIRAPKNLGFIAIDGNLDISLRENYLYADDYYNLLVIDISTIDNPQLVTYIPNLKDEIYFDEQRAAFLVDYEMLEEKVYVNCEDEAPFELVKDNVVYYNTDIRFTEFFDLAVGSAAPDSRSGGGGSLARVAFIKDYFYYVNNHSMKIFDVARLEKPDLVNTVYLDWGVETIFPYKDKIFIGANDGMHILDNSDPTNPRYLSTFRHARACDPVAVEGNTAFVTLRDGTECQNFINQLDVVDVTNLLEPQLIASYPMHHPHGLSVRDNILYLCEDDQGLKVFNVANLEEITKNQLAHIRDHAAYDVISVSSAVLLLIGDDGFYQYDTSDPENLVLLSSIKISK